MTRMAPQDQPRLPSLCPRRGSTARGRRTDPHNRLLHCLLAMAGTDATLEAASSRPWASATFQGSQYQVVLRFGGNAPDVPAAAMAAQAPEAEFGIAGHIVADVSIDAQETGADAGGMRYALLSLSILIVEDW